MSAAGNPTAQAPVRTLPLPPDLALSLYEIDVRDELFDEADDAPQSAAFIADGEHFLLEVTIQWKRPGNPEGQVPRR